jgi:hypothetical protein
LALGRRAPAPRERGQRLERRRILRRAFGTWAQSRDSWCARRYIAALLRSVRQEAPNCLADKAGTRRLQPGEGEMPPGAGDDVKF